MPDHLPSRVFRFGEFVLDTSAYELRRQQRAIKLERRPMELLMLLVGHSGELVSRNTIVERLWGHDVFIDIDASVNTVIRKVRRALRDDADRPAFIQTVPGKGYRFIAEVESGTGAALAVLPFAELQGAADHQYVADGLTEETIAQLGQLDPQRLIVIGRTTSMAYRDTTKTVDVIARELGVDYLVEGAFRMADGRCRITARLIRARDHVQVRGETYERKSPRTMVYGDSKDSDELQMASLTAHAAIDAQCRSDPLRSNATRLRFRCRTTRQTQSAAEFRSALANRRRAQAGRSANSPGLVRASRD